MKHFLILIAFAVLAFNCQTQINGSGNVISKNYNKDNFNTIINDLPADITIDCAQGNAYSVKIDADDNIIPLILCDISNNELVLHTKSNTNFNTKNAVKVTITCPSLKAISLLGSGNITLNGNLITHNFNSSIMGSGDIVINNAIFDTLVSHLTGSGSIAFAKCITQEAEYAVLGSGNINAADNIAKNVKVKNTGSGEVSVNVNEHYNLELTGSGDINVTKGANASGKSNITGSGDISGL
jgi:hypothetical protein